MSKARSLDSQGATGQGGNWDRDQIRSMFTGMAKSGHAPSVGCGLFGVGYDDAFDTLNREYLNTGFRLGDSSEKFVVGAYGSGKTHFLRQLQEIAGQSWCVTSEVALNKDVDFTNYISVFNEVAKSIRPPKGDDKQRGVGEFLKAAARRIKKRLETGDERQDRGILRKWASSLQCNLFEFPQFGETLGRALAEMEVDNHDSVRGMISWLGGEFNSRKLCKEFDLTYVEKGDLNRRARQALFSLGQFARLAGFRGTVVAFDEAEQGLDVDKKKFGKILSMLQSTINSVADLRGGAMLIVYAFTPDLLFRFNEFPALEQRISSTQGFFEGNPYAPVIPLERNVPRDLELGAIAKSLCDLFFKWFELDAGEREAVVRECMAATSEIAARRAEISSRRETVKRVCSLLLQAVPPDQGAPDFDEFCDDDEV